MEVELNNDSYDPYVSYYQTPKKTTGTTGSVEKGGSQPPNKGIKLSTTRPSADENKRVFNPYQKEEKEEQELPEFVDLDKNVYAEQKRSRNADGDEELPLLEELGISPENIKKKLISVLTFHKIDKQILEDSDMAGPILVFILFGISLVLVKIKLITFSKQKHTLAIYMDSLYLGR
jgi:hypothetical protein